MVFTCQSATKSKMVIVLFIAYKKSVLNCPHQSCAGHCAALVDAMNNELTVNRCAAKRKTAMVMDIFKSKITPMKSLASMKSPSL